MPESFCNTQIHILIYYLMNQHLLALAFDTKILVATDVKT